MALTVIPEVGNPRRNLVGVFHFAVVEGMMKLRPAGMKPTCRRTGGEVKEGKRQEEGETEGKIAQKQKEDDGEGEGDGKEDPDSSTASSIPKKRKAPKTRIVSSKKWRGSPDPGTSEPNKFRLDFAFRGRETGDGEIQSGTGWIEWEKNNSTVLQGMMDIGFIDSPVLFYGYKTELLAKGSMPDSEWGDYSDDPYEMAPRSMWRF